MNNAAQLQAQHTSLFHIIRLPNIVRRQETYGHDGTNKADGKLRGDEDRDKNEEILGGREEVGERNGGTE
jgi:hypothetical protein